MKASRHEALSELIQNLQSVMDSLGIWNCPQPSVEAMASVQPFALDTMSLEQWLRYVFIARLQVLIEQKMPLPEQCHVTPMAQEVFKDEKFEGLVVAINHIDELLNKQCM